MTPNEKEQNVSDEKNSQELIEGVIADARKILNMAIVKYPCVIMDSAKREFGHFKEIISAVKKAIEEDKADAIVIPHGTDTLAYTASILTFAFPCCYIPIILTAAQRSIGDFVSDGTTNLRGAIVAAKRLSGWNAKIATRITKDDFIHEGSPFPEVLVYFNFQLFLGSRISKIDAFQSQKFPRVGTVGGKKGLEVFADVSLAAEICSDRVKKAFDMNLL